MNTIHKKRKGFTLLEIILVIAAIGILASIVLVAINPNRQLEAARNAKRRADINTITKAIQQYSIDNKGQYPTGIDIGAKAICRNGTPVGCIDLSNILAPTYVASIPEPDSNNYYVRRSNNSIEISHPRDTIWNIGGTPSLDLNFAKNKSLIDGVSGNNLISFTRAETTPTANSATYVGEDGLIKTAAANEPRFDHNPLTGESLGLLVEEQRTNSQKYSNNFATNWTLNQNGTAYVIPNAGTSPSGQQDASKLINASGAYIQGPPFISGNNIGFGMSATYNLSTKTITTSGSVVSTSLTELGNGWFRCAFMPNTSIKYAQSVFAKAAESSSLIIEHNAEWLRLSTTGGLTGGILIWGAQVESGSFPTSYIPTSASAVTRAADVANISTAGWMDFSGGTIATEYYRLPMTSFFNAYLWSLGVGNPSLSYTNGGLHNDRDFVGGGQGYMAFPIVNGKNKAAFKFQNVGQWTTTGNGATPISSTISGAWSSSSPPTLSLGNGHATPYGGLRASAPIARLTYWPTRLPNSTLQSLTQ